MAEGAQILGRQGDSYKIQVSIPTDEDGFLAASAPTAR